MRRSGSGLRTRLPPCTCRSQSVRCESSSSTNADRRLSPSERKLIYSVFDAALYGLTPRGQSQGFHVDPQRISQPIKHLHPHLLRDEIPQHSKLVPYKHSEILSAKLSRPRNARKPSSRKSASVRYASTRAGVAPMRGQDADALYSQPENGIEDEGSRLDASDHDEVLGTGSPTVPNPGDWVDVRR